MELWYLSLTSRAEAAQKAWHVISRQQWRLKLGNTCVAEYLSKEHGR